MRYGKLAKVEELVGKTLTSIENVAGDLIFRLDTGETYQMGHHQDCCESVDLEDVAGDLKDLIGTPLTMAEETVSGENPPGIDKGYQDSFTWTFYKFATVRGYVTLRWYGESNGYYSESVDFERIK